LTYSLVRKVIGVSVLWAALFCLFAPLAWSGVIVDDVWGLKGHEVMLRAETRGKIFAKGGELVEFFVEGESIGKTLSGGDGVAYKPFVLVKLGLQEIRVKLGDEEGIGLLLSLKDGAGIVFVDVVGALLEGRFSMQPKEGSQQAIEEINKLFQVLFLQRGFFGVRTMKAWLEDKGFMALPVFPWRDGKLFERMAERGLKINAVVGSGPIIESAKKYQPLSFSFEPVEDAVWAGDWTEITSKMKEHAK
jgi:hypothetical protein